MFQELIMPAFGGLVLVAWTASGAWALRPAATDRALATAGEPGQPGQPPSPAAARATRGLTRNGLLGALVMVAVAFLLIRIFFELSGWFQLAWVIAGLAAAYIVWRIVLLWPDRHVEQQRRALLTAHGFQRVRPPWGMIIAAVALLAIWFLPPLLLF